jgi:ABC-type polar amino acid transport system ATPase subunit
VKGFGIHIEGLRKRYGEGNAAVDALKDVNMTVAPGEVVGLIGPSGSGKSTLLKCLGAVIEPTAGRMTLGDEVIFEDGWKIPDLRALRRDRIGFVFQAPYLIPFLDVIDTWPCCQCWPASRMVKRGIGQMNYSRHWMLVTVPRHSLPSFPVASSNAWQLHAPWQINRR